jgi:hypothetical protein
VQTLLSVQGRVLGTIWHPSAGSHDAVMQKLLVLHEIWVPTHCRFLHWSL